MGILTPAPARLKSTTIRVGHTHYRFPWRGGNRVTLHRDGPTFFPAMLDAMANARATILLEMYLVSSGRVFTRFATALIDAAHRGVDVRILLDGFGSQDLAAADRARLTGGGVRLVFYNPLRLQPALGNLLRNHRKVLVVDGDRAFTGGMGLTDAFDAAHEHGYWRESVAEIEGPCVTDWQLLFADLWRRSTKETAPLPGAVAVARVPGMQGRVTVNHGPGRTEIQRTFLKHARAARTQVWLSTAYFVPSWKLRRSLRRIARRGVDVRVLVPGPYTDQPAVRYAGSRFYGALLRAGVRIFEYQPRMLHAKAMLCDDWASVGSCNLDRWGMRWNLDANQEVMDGSFTQGLKEMMAADMDEAVELDFTKWRQRPWRHQLLEHFWGWIDTLLDRLTREGRPPG